MTIRTAVMEERFDDMEQKANNILNYYCRWMEERYAKKVININYKKDIKRIIFSILSAKKGEVTVISAPMGYGKSSLLAALIKYMAINDDSFGCIVVKDKISDSKKFAQTLGCIDDDYDEGEICFPWHGYSAEICEKGYTEYEAYQCFRCDETGCQVKKSKAWQLYYPVVAMTHQRLFLKANAKQTLNDMENWVNLSGERCKREYLFIDEKPKFLVQIE